MILKHWNVLISVYVKAYDFLAQFQGLFKRGFILYLFSTVFCKYKLDQVDGNI